MTMGLRQEIISLGLELSEQDNRAFNLWTHLPSYNAAQAEHGDYASNFTPSVSDIMFEATLFIARQKQEIRGEVTDLVPEEEQWFSCPCGEDHGGND
jgi:hypothetical protein